MKIVITGGLGHIGSYLIRQFPQQYPNCEIIMIDNLVTQRFPSLFNLPTQGKYKFIEADVTELDLLPQLVDANIVIHLAAITDATSSFEKRDEVEYVNYTATKKVVEACAAMEVPLLFPSSTSVYGKQDNQVDESCNLEDLKPQSPYAETKLKEESLIQRSVNKLELKAAIFRCGTIFGVSPGMRFHTAVNKFCWQATMGLPLTVWKTAYKQKRPYLDLSDFYRAASFCMEKSLFSGEIYNVVTENLAVKQIVEKISSNVKNVEIEFVESEIMNQLSYEVLNTKLLQAGFSTTGDIDSSIKNTIGLLNQTNSI